MKKRLLSILLVLCMVLTQLPGTAWAVEEKNSNDAGFVIPVSPVTEVPAGYTGIYNAQDLDDIRNGLTGNYILMNDIDLSSWGNWNPIGSSGRGNTFSGTFDGNGHTINNLTINITTSIGNTTSDVIHLGLFGSCTDATIMNLAIKGNIIAAISLDDEESESSSSVYIGAVAGTTGDSNIDNCVSSASIQVDTHVRTYVGGIAGNKGNKGISSNLKNIVDIAVTTRTHGYYVVRSGSALVGGIFGGSSCYEQPVSNCYNYGNISLDGRGYVGGITSSSYDISECYNYGDIQIKNAGSITHAGGITASSTTNNYTPSYTKCQNSGNIEITISTESAVRGSNWAIAGGIVADESATKTSISECSNTGNITIVNLAQYTSSSDYPLAIAQGIGSGIVSDCYNTGEITTETDPTVGRSYAGAAGISCGGKSITNCYNTGAVFSIGKEDSGNSRYAIADGILCLDNLDAWYANEPDCVISYAYCINTVESEFGIPLFPSDMEIQGNFAGFDFESVWKMGDADYLYPMLRALDNKASSPGMPLELVSCTPASGTTYSETALTLIFNQNVELELVGSDQKVHAIRLMNYDTDEEVWVFDLYRLADYYSGE